MSVPSFDAPASHDPALPTLDEIALAAQRLAPVEFLARFPGHFLLVTAGAGPESAAAQPWQTIDTNDLKRAGGSRLSGVLAVRKRELGNAWASKITVGRARNNDLQMHDLSVSKMHAWFFDSEDAGRAIVKVCDGGSRNGTFVDGVRLGVAAVALRPGALVRFGTVTTRFVDPLGLRAAVGGDLKAAAGMR